MRSVPLDLDSYKSRLKAVGVDAATLPTPDATGTLFMPEQAHVPSEIEALPILDDDLDLGPRIGAGGMGQIRVAKQLPLHREIAVKCAVKGATDRHENANALLREARVTGALQHPNIVPIHALGRTREGDVLFVMKRIEGSAWMEPLRNRPSLHHDIDRHVGVLIDVCNAVQFAHTRGILHRDLKPENVMLGSFGEVYVLDWGIAVSTGDTHIEGVTHARDLTGVSGTPQYMAPEMAMPGGPGEAGEPVDHRTDIYLLGGILHFIITGAPPHKGSTVTETLHAAYVSAPPVFGHDVPDELAAICRRALARARSERFASVAEFRDALDRFLKHSNARSVTREAENRLDELRTSIAAGKSDVDVNRAFSTARFGFELALREWPESEDARDGLRNTLTVMAEWEVKRGHADSARALLNALDDKPRQIVDSVDALDKELNRIVAFARDHDVRAGSSQRAIIVAGVGIGWFIFAMISGYLHRQGIMVATWQDMAIANAVLAVVCLIATRWLRSRPDVRKVSLRYMHALTMGVVAITAAWLIIGPAGVPIHAGLAMAHIIHGFNCFVLSLFAEKMLRFGTAALALSLPVLALFPEYCFETNGGVMVIVACYIAWRWRK